MTDITGTRIKPGDVLVFRDAPLTGELGFFLVCEYSQTHNAFLGAEIHKTLDGNFQGRCEVTHHADDCNYVLIVAHAAQLDKPTWPRELRNWIYETWEEHRQG